MTGLLLWMALACSTPEAEVAAPPVAVGMWVEGVTGAGGTLVVQVVADERVELSMPTPEAPGLDLRAPATTTESLGGGRSAITSRYPFTGGPGSFEIHGLTVAWAGEGAAGDAEANAVFVDLDAKPPRPEEPEDIVVPPPASRSRDSLTRVAIVGGLALLLGGGLFVAFRPRRRPSAVVAEPADVLALRAWAAVRADAGIDDYDKALAISRIFRDYAEAVLHFPASAWTTTEVLGKLGAMAHLPEGNVARARRLLRATDRIKYADAAARADLFDDLDADLRAFVESTRPRAMGAA